jgi:acylphosphatase
VQGPSRREAELQGALAAMLGYVRDAELGTVELVAATPHARVTALAKWTATNDPDRQSDPEAVMEATARFPLAETDRGIGFEAAAFQEFVLFIEDLPF